MKRSLVDLVRERQDDPISIRELARKLRRPQKEVLQECEDEDLNVNIGIMTTGTGCGVGTFDNIGDFTIEDLNVNIHAGENDA